LGLRFSGASIDRKVNCPGHRKGDDLSCGFFCAFLKEGVGVRDLTEGEGEGSGWERKREKETPGRRHEEMRDGMD
jgi:hypothetical protein